MPDLLLNRARFLVSLILRTVPGSEEWRELPPARASTDVARVERNKRALFACDSTQQSGAFRGTIWLRREILFRASFLSAQRVSRITLPSWGQAFWAAAAISPMLITRERVTIE